MGRVNQTQCKRSFPHKILTAVMYTVPLPPSRSAFAKGWLIMPGTSSGDQCVMADEPITVNSMRRAGHQGHNTCHACGVRPPVALRKMSGNGAPCRSGHVRHPDRSPYTVW